MSEPERAEKDDTASEGKKFKRSRDKRKQEKFVPTFKKKVPTWKQIENELTDLTPKYEEVKYIFNKLNLLYIYL